MELQVRCGVAGDSLLLNPEAKWLDLVCEPLSPNSRSLFSAIQTVTLHLGQHLGVSVNLLLTDTQYFVIDMQSTEVGVMRVNLRTGPSLHGLVKPCYGEEGM